MIAKFRFKILFLLYMGLFASSARGQYTVGQTISQETRNKIVSMCSNASGNQSLGSLLEPGQGMANRVLWLNFFESW